MPRSDRLRRLAHELRAPLEIIDRSAVELAASPPPEQTAAAIARIRRMAAHARQLLIELPQRGGEPRQPAVRQRLPVHETLATLAADVHAATGVAIGLDDSCPPDLAVHVAPTAFRQVMLNLLRNAIAAGGQTPCVRIEVVASQEAGDAAGRVRVAVVDAGCGLDAAACDDLMAGRGPGLGLAIVRAIVEDHGGTLHIASDGRGRGCRVETSWPPADAATID